MNKILRKILFLLILPVVVYSQQFNVTADKTTVGENERFQVYFTFEGGDVNSVSNFRAPDMTGLKVLGGPNQSTSMQIINGRMSGSITYSYIIQAIKQGVFTIGSAYIDFQGKRYNTNPIKIQVVKSGTTTPQGDRAGGVSDEELAKNVFILATADKNSVFLGEQVTVSFKLYTKTNISNPTASKAPTYNGFWVEKLDFENERNWRIEMYKGERYRVATLDKVALFPSKSGKLEITPYELDVPVIIQRKNRSRDLFDDFFNDSFFGRSQTVNFAAKSNALNITVNQLPETGKPESFNGAVGNFRFNSSIDKKEVEVNEPVTLKINISGAGNISLLELPEPKLPAGFEVYDPKTSENVSRNNRITGTKNIEYLIVPRLPGEKFIPPFEFSYFDPQTKKYHTFSTERYEIKVNPGQGVDYSTGNSGFSKADVKLLNQDIRYIKTSDFNLQRISDNQLLGWWFWIGLVIPVFGLFGFVMIKKRQDKLAGNMELVKFRKAEKAAKNRLKLAKKELDAGNKSKFYDEISNALNGYLEDKLNISRSEFSIDKAIVQITSAGIDSELVTNVKTVFDKCEFARFSPKVEGLAAETELYDTTVNIIVKLENELGRKRK